MKKLKRILLDDLEQLSAAESAKYVGGAGGEGDPPYIPPLVTSSPNYDYITSFPPLGGSRGSGLSISGSSSNSGWSVTGNYNNGNGWNGTFGYGSDDNLRGSIGYNGSNGLGGSIGYDSDGNLKLGGGYKGNGLSVTGTVNYNPSTGSSSGSVTVSKTF